MKLYYSPGACSLASDIVLREAKINADFVKVDLKAHKTEKGEDFMAINPKGYVPTLVLDNGDVLTENVAILPYLASLGSHLLPESGMDKWHAVERLGFVSTEIHKAFKPMFDPSSSDEAKKKAKELVAKRLENAATMLGDREYMVGNAFSVVDAYLFVMLMWCEKFGIPIPQTLQRYAQRMRERGSVKEALHFEGLDKKSPS